jgi:DNA-binding transcriptional ArsR family regulator
VLRFEVTAADLLRSRFALSPLFEVASVLRALGRVAHGRPPWMSRLQPAFARVRRHPDLDGLLALLSHHHGPTFMVPPPRSLAQSIEDDLAAVRATPMSLVRAEIAQALQRKPVTDQRILTMLQGRSALERIAQVLELAWHELIGPDWPLLRAICERDVIYRAGELSHHGWAAALHTLHPQVRWRAGGIEIRRFSGTEPIEVGGAGLLFIPATYVYPGVAVHAEDPWPKAIVYPARGLAALWEPAPAVPGVLTELLGRSRARLLVTLTEPASTTQLARTTKLAVGSVGDHLQLLKRAGLLTAARSGRSVLYRRTPLGDLIAGVGEADPPD